MKLSVRIDVSTEDYKFSRESVNELVIATDVDGVDAATAKQDFLTQAENLMRSISDNQIPALYAAVEHVRMNTDMEKPEEPTETQKIVHAKLKALKDKKGKEQPQGDEQQHSEEDK